VLGRGDGGGGGGGVVWGRGDGGGGDTICFPRGRVIQFFLGPAHDGKYIQGARMEAH
jgi:hypothetical protein